MTGAKKNYLSIDNEVFPKYIQRSILLNVVNSYTIVSLIQGYIGNVVVNIQHYGMIITRKPLSCLPRAKQEQI